MWWNSLLGSWELGDRWDPGDVDIILTQSKFYIIAQYFRKHNPA